MLFWKVGWKTVKETIRTWIKDLAG